MEYVFGKFLKAGKFERRRYRISTDQDFVQKWTGASNEPAPQKADEDKSEKAIQSPFYRLNEDIFSNLLALYDAVPTLLGVYSVYTSALVEEGILKSFRSDGEVIEKNDEYEYLRIEMEKYPKIDNAIKKFSSAFRISPHFSKFYIIGLVSLYDHFIYSLAREVIRAKPEIVFNSERNVTYASINTFNSVEDIRNHLIDTEAENLLRDSHEEQLKWFSKKLGMKIEPDERLYSAFVEVCERRNLFTHTGGRVTAQYMTKCAAAGCKLEKVEIGKNLNAGPKYFRSSVETIIEVSAQLIHVVWQKIDKEGGAEASKALVNITYNLIYDEKYDLAIRIIEFLLSNKATKMEDGTRKTHIVNCANAMKLAGKDGYIAKLEAEDWSAATLDFKLSVAAVKDDKAEFLDLLDRAVKSEAISKSDIREWPVFQKMRSEPEVIKKFEVIFGEPLVEEKSKN